MPIIAECCVPDCQYNGSHGFTVFARTMLQVHHYVAGEGNHVWYMGRNPENGEVVMSADASDVFERTVVPDVRRISSNHQATEVWIEAQRARIRGVYKGSDRLLKQCEEMQFPRC